MTVPSNKTLQIPSMLSADLKSYPNKLPKLYWNLGDIDLNILNKNSM